MDKLLRGKNALITGAGQNIGKSIALEMARQACNVFFTDIEEDRCRQLEEELRREHPGNCQGRLSDISRQEDVKDLLKFLDENGIKIDILVNNVGIQYETASLDDLDLGEWRRTFETNIFGPMLLTKNIAQRMKKDSLQGSIIFLTSIHQFEPVRWPSYSSSKAALGMIIEELAIELAKYKIRVNGIAPGWTGRDKDGELFYEKYSLLQQRSVDPCYIGRAAVYLASDYFSKFTTGTVLKIDGGTSLYNNRVDETW
jgi:NAD(P)-dependent dehydrogenase (short-subunit alcohol dehydrogenase family)